MDVAFLWGMGVLITTPYDSNKVPSISWYVFVFHHGKQRGVDDLLTCHEAWLLTVLTFASEAQANILGIDNLKLLSLKILWSNVRKVKKGCFILWSVCLLGCVNSPSFSLVIHSFFGWEWRVGVSCWIEFPQSAYWNVLLIFWKQLMQAPSFLSLVHSVWVNYYILCCLYLFSL